MSTLLAGPWVGEFGWEIFAWQGYLRKLAATKQYDEVFVAAPAGHEALYRDFATRFFPLPHYPDAERWLAPSAPGINPFRDMIGERVEPVRAIEPGEQTFIKLGYGSRASDAFDVVFHFRLRAQAPERNYPHTMAVQLVDALRLKGLRIACIGRPDASYAVDGTEDLRGQTLQDDMDILAAAKVAAGPSSGPLHLASLCGCPHVVWGERHWNPRTGRGLREAYQYYRNPLRTPCAVIDGAWRPPPKVIAAQIIKSMKARQ